MLPVYARVARGHNTAGRHLPVHSPEFAVPATDKVELHRTAVRRGWPVPAGAVCEEPSRLLDAAVLGLPALVKEARSESRAPTHTTAWPVASLGHLDSGCNPGRRIRVAPATLPDRARCALGTAIRDILLQVPEERAQAAQAWLLGLPSDALHERTTAAAQPAIGISSLKRGQNLLP